MYEMPMSRLAHEKVYGVAAVRAVFNRRPDDLVRIAYSAELRRELGPMLKAAAAARVAYEERSEDDLARIAGSVHHEGICCAVRPRRVLGLPSLLRALAEGKARSVIALDGVLNPHNVGAIVRTAAFFGVDALLVAVEGDRAPLSPAAVRVAQGGAEALNVVRVDALAPALDELAHEGIAVVGTDVRASRALDELQWPARCVLVLGNEGEGMNEETRRVCTELVVIGGSGAVESLNVSVAAGVVISSWARAANRFV